MVLQCSKLFFHKVSSEFLRQDSQNSYSFGKIQNVGKTELSEEKFSVSLEKDFTFRFHIYFPPVLLFVFSFQIYVHIYIYIYIYIYIERERERERERD